MIQPTYHRQSRTPNSEQYQLMENDQRLGHLDLHYGSSEVYGTLVLDRELSEEELTRLIEQIDDDLVMSSDVPREDFLVRVYSGRELGLFSDELLREEYPDGHEGLEEE